MSLETWDKLKSVPLDALKKIEAGRLKGRHDISPVWRYERMTEVFGLCGIGWKYEIESIHWQDVGAEKMVYVQINLYVKDENKWSAPIPGFGGDFALQQERAGLHANDEALKMATTDALGYAMQKLGLAADVYRGRADDSKYGRETQQANTNTPANANKGQNAPKAEEKPASATKDQLKKINDIATALGWSVQDIKDSILATYGAARGSEMTLPQAKEMIDYLEGLREQKAAETSP